MKIKRIFVLTGMLFLANAYAQEGGPAAAFETLSMDGYQMLSVGSVERVEKTGGYWFTVRQNYLIEGRDLGFSEPVGSITRTFYYKCGEQTAALGQIAVTNLGLKPMGSKLMPGEITELKRDPELKQAAAYVCGDLKAKLPKYDGPPKSDPRDEKILLCKFNRSTKPFEITFNEVNKSVNGGAAIFRDKMIKYALFVDNEIRQVTISRYSGSITVNNHADGTAISGTCEQVDRKKF